LRFDNFQENLMAAKTKTTKAARPAAKRSDKAASDAIELLERDHRTVESYFDQYKDAQSADDKKVLAGKICATLRVHAQIEEELLYPAARQAIEDKDLIDEATVEHADAKVLIAEIEAMQPGMPLYDAKVTVLGEQIAHHVKEEEDELFPKVRETGADLDALGGRMAQRKAELVALLADAALA
jgi:hemerythrin superfamily protein